MLLHIDDIQTFYGSIQALKGISFTVDQGEIEVQAGRVILRDGGNQAVGIVFQRGGIEGHPGLSSVAGRSYLRRETPRGKP